MPALDAARLEILKTTLREDYLPYLPPLLDTSKPQDQQDVKNLSRALSAFALSKLCEITPSNAGQAIIDDFDDYGVDAIYLDQDRDTLFLVQSKLKKGSAFTQDEALAFCQGVKKLLDQLLDDFNENVQKRRLEIEGALEDCSHIQLVVAHVGEMVTGHADHAIMELTEKESEEDDRLQHGYLNFDSGEIIQGLQQGKALPKVHADLWLWNSSKVVGGKQTYIGLAALSDLAFLHKEHGAALYEKNIRAFLGKQTEVNKSISGSLKSNPKNFFYLNNGVTLLCDLVDQKGANSSKPRKRKFKLRGASVINGAQTISSAASYIEDNSAESISDAKITVTLIQEDTQSDFGKQVTRARNHQNPVHFTNFVALDDEQERLRREISYLGMRYVYKAEAASGLGPDVIHVDETAQALSLFQSDPRYPVWLKKDSSKVLDTSDSSYKSLFVSSLTAQQVINAVRLYRYVKTRMESEANHHVGLERLAYKHGVFALGWIIAKQLNNEFNNPSLFDEHKITTVLGPVFDQLRQKIYDQANSNNIYCGPLALFRNQSRTVPVIEAIMLEHFVLQTDAAIPHKRTASKHGEAYPKALFDYMISKAPQVANLT